MTAFVDVQLIEGLGLPYAPGAEAGLLDPALDPFFNDSWQAVVAAFPSLTLTPLFDGLSVEELADLVDGIRFDGVEPPNPFVWYSLACEEADVSAIVTAMLALPMVVFAEERLAGFVASTLSYGTNPQSLITLQIQPAPNGIDAIYAWQVAGGAGDGIRVADIEGGWRLDHEELLTADIRKLSVFGSSDVDHGTAVAGIVVGSDNGVGTIGIVPNAGMELVTDDRGFGPPGNVAAAIIIATASLGAGDVLLLELALPFPPKPGDGPDVLREFSRSEQAAIALATSRGITVIEPAGNGRVNLDDFAVLAHTRPGSPTFVESGAIVVGAGELTGAGFNVWSRTFSSFGSRVDCFAAGDLIRAPSSTATNSYQNFSGTSGASAIIAGLVASLQAMTRNATGAVLLPADVRRLLRSALLGTLPGDPLGARIGAMPDLRRITRAQGLIRVLPIGAAAIGGNALLIVHLDADNRFVRRNFTLLTGWGPPIPSPTPDGSPSASDAFPLTAAQPAVTSSDEDNPISRTVFDAFFSGPGGIHHMFWDTLSQAGNVTNAITPISSAAQGRALAVARPLDDLQLIAAISPEGRLNVITGAAQNLSLGMSTPLVIDALGMYRRVAGPTLVSRGSGLADIVMIEDGGSLNWFRGRLPATIGTGWSGPVTEPAGVSFDPGARPALLASGGELLAAAVGTDGSLRAITIDPVNISIDAPIEVDVSVAIDRSGPVALARTALNFVVLAVDTQGTLRAATRLIAGGSWTPLLPVLSSIAISPLGGVSAVSIDIGVMAIVVGLDGIVCSAISVDGLIWSPLIPLP